MTVKKPFPGVDGWGIGSRNVWCSVVGKRELDRGIVFSSSANDEG